MALRPADGNVKYSDYVIYADESGVPTLSLSCCVPRKGM